jgi:dephospho-CoA kinase
MIKLGITGGIGSGKTVVCEILSLHGVPVYIADVESKILTDISPVIRKKLIELFGEDIYNGEYLNRSLLASYIFNDKDKLQAVNNIIHPEVYKHFGEWCASHSKKRLVAMESAILFESGFNKVVNKTIMVYAPLDIRVKRVMERDNIPEEKVLARIGSQMPDEKKAELSDFVIVNDDTKSLLVQVKEILQQLNNNIYG